MSLADWNYCPHCGSPLVRRERFGALRPLCEGCDFVAFADPKVTVAVLIEQEGRVLLGKRAFEPGQGLWCLPGGYMDYGERVREAAAREALEETGLTVHIGALLGVWDWYFGDEATGKQGIVLLFRATVEAGEAQAADDMGELGWFAPDALPPLAFPSDEAVIVQACRGEGVG